MALEDLTGSNKFITALNAAWPVDDDWVDEGDNHIRGIKNVLKNTFPSTNGAVHWTATQARFADGSSIAPGISWINDPGSGWLREAATGKAHYAVAGIPKMDIGVTAVHMQVPLQLEDGSVGAPSMTWLNDPNSGWFRGGDGEVKYASNGVVGVQLHPLQVVVTHGYTSNLSNITAAPLVVDNGGAGEPGIGFVSQGVVSWVAQVRATDFQFGSSAGGGPLGGGYAMAIQAPGTIYAGAYNNVSDARFKSAVEPVANALADLMKIRGVRYEQSWNKALGLGVLAQDVEPVYPELVSEIGVGDEARKALNYGGLIAPLIEAIRELSARLSALEAKHASH